MKKFLLSMVSAAVMLISCDDNNVPFNDHSENHKVVFNLDSIESIIREKTDSFTEAHIIRDTSYLNQSFSKDARVYPPGLQVVKGAKAISKLNAEWVSYDIHEFKEISNRFYGNHQYVIDEGLYSMKYGTDSINDSGKYVNIWRYENGVWKIHSNIWNGNPQSME